MGAVITRVKFGRDSHVVYISYMGGGQETTLMLTPPPEIVSLFVRRRASDEALNAAEKALREEHVGSTAWHDALALIEKAKSK